MKGSKRREKEDERVEREGRMPDCSNIDQGQGRAGRTQNMCQVTSSL